MALSSFRLRRALSLTSSLLTKHHTPSTPFPAIPASPSLSSATNTVNSQNPSPDLISAFQSRLFRSTSALLSSSRFRNNNSNNNDEIGPDTILFEGCDYNHWLITMDFPKDPAPTREEMIETYLQTLAKVVGSYEEAKKKMYAFSTTTYQGFQCLVTEEMSEKFRGLPGVVFILPDSYIDPVNKEYGGDKYDNGVITPRPPPVQYGRPGRRYYDGNREFSPNRPGRPMPNQEGNPPYGNQRPMYGDTRNFGQQQSSPMQPNFTQQQSSPMQPNFTQQGGSPMQPNYRPAGSGDGRDPMPMNNAPGGRDPMPSYQATYSQNEQGYYNHQGGRIPPEQRDYQRDTRGDSRSYAPPQGATYGQGAGGNYGQMPGGNYQQGAGGNYGQGAGGNYGQGAMGNYGQGTGGNYGQGTGGNYGQGAGVNYGQGAGAVHGQETGFGYGQTYPGHGEDHRFSQGEQRNSMQGEPRTYAPMAHTGQTK